MINLGPELNKDDSDRWIEFCEDIVTGYTADPKFVK